MTALTNMTARASALAVGLLLATPASPASAAGCDLPPQGEAVVVEVIDARSVRLQDGRDIKLSGIEPIVGRTASAVGALSQILIGRRVTLRSDDDAPDRYGRQPAFVVLDASAFSVQAELLARGEAFVAADAAPADCRTELLGAEAQARKSRAGVWENSGVIKNAENSGDVVAQVGRFTLIEGKVVSVREAGATVYLNFGRRWTQDFAVTISRRMLASFTVAGVDLKSFGNKVIRVRGWVEQRGGPRIDIRHPGQIEMLGAR